jgi:glutathione S-transferase
MIIYGMTGSGNCYKPVLLLSLLKKPYQWVEVDLLHGENRKPEFLARNPHGKVPVLEVNGRYLAESNAMLCHLAEGTPLLPQDAWQRAKVMEWLFFEQYSHEPNIATVRFWIVFLNKEVEWAERIEAKRKLAYAALDLMEQRLATNDWLVGESCTIADIALYAYTHVAHEGGFDMQRYPAIRAWLECMECLPGYVRISHTAIAAA